MNYDSLAIFPTFRGLTWNRNRVSHFNSLLQTSVSGAQAATQLQVYPDYTYTLEYDALPSDSVSLEWQQLLGFWNFMGGRVGLFRFDDWEDNAVTAQGLGAGDGTTTQFQLYRTLGGFTEPVLAANVVNNVYLNGVVQSASTGTGGYGGGGYGGSGYGSGPSDGWTVSNGVLTFSAAPAAEALVTADFSFYWVCRFPEDTLDANTLWYQFWALKKLQIKTVLYGSG